MVLFDHKIVSIFKTLLFLMSIYLLFIFQVKSVVFQLLFIIIIIIHSFLLFILSLFYFILTIFLNLQKPIFEWLTYIHQFIFLYLDSKVTFSIIQLFIWVLNLIVVTKIILFLIIIPKAFFFLIFINSILIISPFVSILLLLIYILFRNSIFYINY
jgi:hypothetical protein